MPTEELFTKYGVDPVTYKAMKSRGFVLNTYRSLSGRIRHNYVAQPPKPQPRILLVEKYRLSTYLGRYGAGRTVTTFSLLPGEKTTISVSTYRKSETTRKESSSILDSYTEESAEEYEDSVMAENSTKENSQESFNYHAEAEASASWGWGKAKVSGGVEGGTSSAREEFAKSASSATSKHAAKSSAKRDVQVDSSFEAHEEEGQETSLTREVRNINVGRTLNFVFRQMNQEFITILHLVDVRVAFFNGYRGSRDERALPELDDLLRKYVLAERRKDVREGLLADLRSIRDWKGGVATGFVEPFAANAKPGESWWRVRRGYTSRYQDETGNDIEVPGVIVDVNKNVMRTDGVIVEALLGVASGLDEYSQGLQDQKVKSQELDNRLKELAVHRAELETGILERRDEAGARVHRLLYPPSPVPVPGAPAEPDEA
jgi:hypothetical protein